MALKISVIVCAHNEARYLSPCLHSLLGLWVRSRGIVTATSYTKVMCRSRDLDQRLLRSVMGESHVTKLHVRDVDIDAALDNAVRRAQSDFLEMPDLRLTLPQAARLWAYHTLFCSEVLAMLVENRFLVRSRDGFIRAENRA